jgi:hypothetical protein
MITPLRRYLPSLSRSYLHTRAREAKAMTIGIGFKCSNGVVLCADSQISKEGGLKYNEKKIYTINGVHPSDHDYHGITLCYAGDPDIMKLLCERIDGLFGQTCAPQDWDGSGLITWNDMFRGEVEKTLRGLYKTHSAKDQQLELLCAIFSKEAGVSLYRAQGRVVRSSEHAECIGVGDSSVLRFLADLFATRELSVLQGLTLGCYMVAKARTYIAGCGGPTQAFFMTHEGKYVSLERLYRNREGLSPEDGLEKVEQAISVLFHKLSRKKLSKEGYAAAYEEFRQNIRESDFGWTEIVELSYPDCFKPSGSQT